MDPLEQELENIKLELREIEKFDPRNQKGETSYEFFMRVYGKYRDADVIYQADLMLIDNRLLKNLKNFFRRGKYEQDQITSLQELLPSRSERTIRLSEDIEATGLTRQDISPLAAGLLVKRQYIFHVRESSTI